MIAACLSLGTYHPLYFLPLYIFNKLMDSGSVCVALVLCFTPPTLCNTGYFPILFVSSHSPRLAQDSLSDHRDQERAVRIQSAPIFSGVRRTDSLTEKVVIAAYRNRYLHFGRTTALR